MATFFFTPLLYLTRRFYANWTQHRSSSGQSNLNSFGYLDAFSLNAVVPGPINALVIDNHVRHPYPLNYWNTNCAAQKCVICLWVILPLNKIGVPFGSYATKW